MLGLKIYKITVRVISPINQVITKLLNLYLNFSNRKAGKILVYSDSRGLNCEQPWKIKNYRHTYAHLLNKKYNVKLVLAPHNFTTLLDFVKFLECNDEKFDAIVAHVGIVDFAPRPVSSYQNMISSKLKVMEELHLYTNGTRYDEIYESEHTISFADDAYIQEISSRLQRYKNIVFVNTNLVNLEYRGNYWRPRPENINLQKNLELKFLRNFNGLVVDMDKAICDRQQEFTVDNVHLNRKGHRLLFRLLSNPGILS